MAQAVSRPLPHPMLMAEAPPAPSRASGRTLAWTGSAGLHLAAGLLLLFGMPAHAPEPMPVMLLEMPAPEPVAPEAQPAPEPMPAEPAVVAEAAPTPPAPPPPALVEPPPEPPVAEAPPEPQPPLAEAMPEPAQVAPLPEPALAELPMPPPAPRPPAPQHRPAPPRPVAAQPQPAATAPAAASAAAAPVAPAPAAAPPASYIARLFAALERHKTYPQEARYRRAQGVAMLHFRMRRDGTVIGYRLDRSAGDAALDAAVLAMIERASPLPAPPAELPGEAIELTVPVRFALR